MIADDASREANQDWCQGRPPRSLYHVPTCRGRNPEKPVRQHPAPDPRPAAEASTDMTPYVINAVGLNRRALGPPHLPNGRLLAPDRTLTWSRTHRVAHPKPPSRNKRPRLLSMLDIATVFAGWEGSSGKSRLRSYNVNGRAMARRCIDDVAGWSAGIRCEVRLSLLSFRRRTVGSSMGRPNRYDISSHADGQVVE